MSDDTVKAALPAKRGKRQVENTDFDAFTGRILRAYGRRVADGDVEALRSLSLLAAELDATTRLAVIGLRQQPHAYSWAEIADRLGVTKQAAQMRFAERTDRIALDRRLVESGLCITVATLARLFADHHPGTPAKSECPACGYRYPAGGSDCPTNATVRPLLYRRRTEDRNAFAVLTPDQFADLHDVKTARANRTAARQAAQPAPSPEPQASLLDLLNAEEAAA
jgi:hypothetical protein